MYVLSSQSQRLNIQAGSEATAADAQWPPSVDPTCIRNLMQVGYLATGRGAFEEARAIFHGLRILRPDSEIPLLGLTVAELSAGNLEQAHVWLEAAKRLQPNAAHTLAIAEVLHFCHANQ